MSAYAFMEPRMRNLVIALVLPLLATAAHAEEPTYTQELAQLRRLMACDVRAGDVAPPEGVSLKSVDASCKKVKSQVERIRKRWLDKAKPFLAKIVPADAPKTVVYPFGGADLLTALTTYPNLTLLTTMSLEFAGDPRAILKLDAGDFRKNMASQHAFIIKLLQVNHNRTVDLQELNRSPIPAPLVFGLTALDMLGYEPIAARWFRLDDKGAVHYLSADEIATFDKSPNGKKQTERNRFFGNVELTFKKSGEPNAPTQTWRHMGTNLRDDALPGSPTLAYLNSLGSPISGMTKAASYLIWRDDFSVIRNYMLDHMTFMVSDTTGITPYHAAEKGFVQETWGTFQGNMFEGAKKGELAMIEMWKTNPQQALPFQYGYPDKNEHDHMMVTRKK